MNFTLKKNQIRIPISALVLACALQSTLASGASCQDPIPKSEDTNREISAEDHIPQSAMTTITYAKDNSLNSNERSQNMTKAGPADVTIDIDPEKRFQEIWGFGATITQSCLHNMKVLPKKDRKELLERLFSHEKGAGFNYLRVPVGANDYSLSNYTLADTPKNKKGKHLPDPKLKYFNFKKDQPFADFIKEVRKINPDLQIMISPWTPPAWMKDNDNLKGGIVKPEAYQAYAEYIMKALDAYKKQGIEVRHLSIMNEPLIGWAKEQWGFSQAFMEVDQQKKFISENFSPLLKARPDIKTKLLLIDHNWDVAHHSVDMMKDQNIKDIAEGVASHCYTGDYSQLKEFMKANPEIPTFQTECTASFSKDPAGGSFRWWQEKQAVDAIRDGTRGALAWNICLDQKGEPRNNGCWGCQGMVTIDQTKKKKPELVYNEEYFALAQTSKYLKRGAVRIDSSDSKEKGIVNVAFINPDGSRVVVMRNTKNIDVKVSVRDDSCKATNNIIPAGGSLSLKWLAQTKKNPTENRLPSSGK